MNSPRIVPAFPAHGTQPARLLAALLHRRRVEPLKALRDLGIYRLADSVFQLRNLGWPVVTDRLDVANQFGEACHVAEYRLPDEAIETAGHGAQLFADDEISLMSKQRAA